MKLITSFWQYLNVSYTFALFVRYFCWKKYAFFDPLNYYIQQGMKHIRLYLPVKSVLTYRVLARYDSTLR